MGEHLDWQGWAAFLDYRSCQACQVVFLVCLDSLVCQSSLVACSGWEVCLDCQSFQECERWYCAAKSSDCCETCSRHCVRAAGCRSIKSCGHPKDLGMRNYSAK